MAGEVVEDHPKRQQEAESGEGGKMLGAARGRRANRRGRGRGRNILNGGSDIPILAAIGASRVLYM